MKFEFTFEDEVRAKKELQKDLINNVKNTRKNLIGLAQKGALKCDVETLLKAFHFFDKQRRVREWNKQLITSSIMEQKRETETTHSLGQLVILKEKDCRLK